MEKINKIASMHGLWVVEDAAEAHFATNNGVVVGSMSKVGTFSFYGNKIVTCGEGGAVTCSDSELYQRMRMLRGQGVDPERQFFHPIVGHNFRLTNVACAMLCAQLKRMDELIEKRSRVIDRYKDALPHQVPNSGTVPAPWMFIGMLGDEQRRDAMQRRLADVGIETRRTFVPLHTMPPHRSWGHFPVSLYVGARGLGLPTHSLLTDDEVGQILSAVERVMKGPSAIGT
jgi:perosamine synthetase